MCAYRFVISTFIFTKSSERFHFCNDLGFLFPKSQGQHRFKPHQISFVGDGYGGSLAIAAMLYCRDSGIFPIPGAVACMSPWLDLTQSLPSWRLNSAYDNFPFEKDGEDRANALVSHDEDLCESYVSPIFATETDYNLSPIMLQIGEAEMYFRFT
jgi:monoterpene epsilon-lactone hydrolase